MTDSPLEPSVAGVEEINASDSAEELERGPEEQANREAPGTVDPDGNTQPVYRRSEPPTS